MVLFRLHPMPTENAMPDDLRPAPSILRPIRWSSSPSSAVAVDWGAVSHPGAGRSMVPDSFYVGRFDRTLEPILTSMPDAAETRWHNVNGYVAIVAGGLDQGALGEVASRTALATLLDLTLETPDWILRYDDPALVERVSMRIFDRLRHVDELLASMGETTGRPGALAVSLTIVALLPPDGLVAHVGGSRAYQLRGNSLLRLTRDHTSAQMLAGAGLIDPQDEAHHPTGDVVTGAVGLGTGSVSVDVERFQCVRGDRLLLCTDGLAETVSDREIADILGANESAAFACQQIVDRALARSGRDSVTVVVGRL
jgi:serine/threonine protein phosphatase PrpC